MQHGTDGSRHFEARKVAYRIRHPGIVAGMVTLQGLKTRERVFKHGQLVTYAGIAQATARPHTFDQGNGGEQMHQNA